MAKVLTQAALDALKPSDRRREIADGKISGLYFIVQPSGARSWAYRYKAGGKSRKLTLGPYPLVGLAAARDKARKAAAERVDGVDPALAKRAAKAEARVAAEPALDLIETVVESYLTRYARKQTRPRSWRQAEWLLRKEIVPVLGKRKLSTIRRTEIVALLDRIADRAPVTANRALAHFRHLCSWALDRGLIEANPAAGIKAPGGEEKRGERTLDDNEVHALWTAAEALGYPSGPIVHLLVLTGARLREVTEMKWPEVDLAARLWIVPAERCKNGRSHQVPLTAQALAVLGRLPRFERCDAVFTHNGKAPVTSMTRAKRVLDLAMTPREPWTIHDIRRSVATGLQKLGVRLEVTEAALNHVGGSRGGIVAVYQKYAYAEEKAVALKRWADHVEMVVTGATAENVVEFAAARG